MCSGDFPSYKQQCSTGENIKGKPSCFRKTNFEIFFNFRSGEQSNFPFVMRDSRMGGLSEYPYRHIGYVNVMDF